MKYSQLIEEISTDVGLSKREASDALLVLRDTILREIENGGEVHIPEIGKFTTAQRSERQGRNPRSGEPITIPAMRVVKFKPASALKDAARG